MISLREPLFLLCALLIAVLLFGGCASEPPLKPGDPYYAPVIMPDMPPAPATYGSLFSDNSAISLFGDKKAARIGDLITIVLSEQTTSNKSANVEVTKDSEIEIGSPVALGGLVTWKGNPLNASASGEREFTGEAGAGQSNSLRGNITVAVMDVWPNGTLVIRGEKWMTLNRGDELIRISGLVRPDDVSSDNEVMSTKIANAQITYTGTGELAASQKMGFASKFFNSSYWPF